MGRFHREAPQIDSKAVAPLWAVFLPDRMVEGQRIDPVGRSEARGRLDRGARVGIKARGGRKGVSAAANESPQWVESVSRCDGHQQNNY